MLFVKFLLIVVEVVTCFLLVGVILLQRPKSQGMGMTFGASMGESLFGAQVGNVLTKTTVVLAAIFLFNTTVLSLIGTRRGSASRSVIDSGPAPAPMSTTLPGSGGMPMPAPAQQQARPPMALPQQAAAPAPAPVGPIQPQAAPSAGDAAK